MYITNFYPSLMVDVIENGQRVLYTAGTSTVRINIISKNRARAEKIGKPFLYGFYKYPLTDEFWKKTDELNQVVKFAYDTGFYDTKQWAHGHGTILPRRIAKARHADKATSTFLSIYIKLEVVDLVYIPHLTMFIKYHLTPAY